MDKRLFMQFTITRSILLFNLFIFLLILINLPLIGAEVPGHNPDLDNKCPEGRQWSRIVAGCRQADCPAGASRTAGLDCNCGEAWSKPFKTCYDSEHLAVSCINKGEECGKIPTETEAVEEKAVEKCVAKARTENFIYPEVGDDEFAKTSIEAFARSCMDSGGIYFVYERSCEYCQCPKVRSKGVCKDPDDWRSVEDIFNLPDVTDLIVYDDSGTIGG
jgi:hypothetical protein